MLSKKLPEILTLKISLALPLMYKVLEDIELLGYNR